ncbi:MAG: hypothetical protein CML50_00710 [Rhodobacteraceae bacterium]|uniref:Helix-turn-helix domain-containing protein n=1 Tax=Salipiger profundus TaxID=1229727 RepID=A0A1U7D0V7_9RHOB|nr:MULTISPECIES: hypothetical protein [Salipiger]APX21715.1 hypothetical protein Ga0080559_TMP919 [Salipiger profundus]MAB04527.1 hypothetical protein [Paracoccaceae bacterium]GGA00493.1 hypothetical protein GCM10011326_09380 [Salipiger profundus]
MNTTQLANELGISKGRVSQWVSEGKLDGCYTGDGRARRFDVEKVRAALQHRLDPGQLLGNGADTRRRLREDEARPDADAPAAPGPREGELRRSDPDRYELARTQKAEEEARRLRRQNMLDEESLVLADKAGREAARALSRELAQIEDLLRRSARAMADELGVDFKAARKILLDLWREHRARRAEALGEVAEGATLDGEERDADF